MVITALVATLLVVSQGPELKGDIAKVQGRWEAQVRSPDPDQTLTLIMTIKGMNVTWAARDPRTGEDHKATSMLSLDESARPKHWNLSNFKSDGRDTPDLNAIYKLEGDTLTLGIPEGPGARRPAEFPVDTGEGPPRMVVFRRSTVDAGAAEPSK
jgi:uncharacterized protein (TIGR03067 family)